MKCGCIVLLRKHRKQFAMLLTTVETKNLSSIFKLLDDKKSVKLLNFLFDSLVKFFIVISIVTLSKT